VDDLEFLIGQDYVIFEVDRWFAQACVLDLIVMTQLTLTDLKGSQTSRPSRVPYSNILTVSFIYSYLSFQLYATRLTHLSLEFR